METAIITNSPSASGNEQSKHTAALLALPSSSPLAFSSSPPSSSPASSFAIKNDDGTRNQFQGFVYKTSKPDTSRATKGSKKKSKNLPALPAVQIQHLLLQQQRQLQTTTATDPPQQESSASEPTAYYNLSSAIDPEDPLTKLLLKGRKRGKNGGTLSDIKASEKRIQTRLNLGVPYTSSTVTTMGADDQLVVDSLDVVEHDSEAKNQSNRTRFYNVDGSSKENNKRLFRNVLDAEDAVIRLKTAALRFPYIRPPNAYYEERTKLQYSDIYPGITDTSPPTKKTLASTATKSTMPSKDALPFSFSRRILFRVNTPENKKRKYCYFERPEVSMWEYDRIPPADFTLKDVEALHENDKEYYLAQLAAIDQQPPFSYKLNDGEEVSDGEYISDTEIEIGDSEPNWFAPLLSFDSEGGPHTPHEQWGSEIESSLYEPEPLLLDNKRRIEEHDESKQTIAGRNNSEIEIIGSALHGTVPSTPTKKDCSEDEIEYVEIPDSPVAMKIVPLFAPTFETSALLPKDANAQSRQLGQSSNPQPQLYQKRKRNFTRMTTAELRKQVDDWGFKSCKTRKDMISLLDSCDVYSPIKGLSKTSKGRENESAFSPSPSLQNAPALELESNHTEKLQLPALATKSDNLADPIIPAIATTARTSLSAFSFTDTLPKSKRDLDKMSTGDLRLLLDRYGFKPTRSRSRMIELLKECYAKPRASGKPASLVPTPLHSTTTDPVSVSSVPAIAAGSAAADKKSGDGSGKALEKMSAKELRGLLDSYGFKPVRGRLRMIELLKDCYTPVAPDSLNTSSSAAVVTDSIVPAVSETAASAAGTSILDTERELDGEISRRISTALTTEEFARATWTNILTYQPLNLEEFCSLLNENLQMKLSPKFVRDWCDQHGVTTTVADERS